LQCGSKAKSNSANANAGRKRRLVENEPGTVLTSLLELEAALFERAQSLLPTQAIGRSDYVLTVENFQKLADRLLGIGGSALDVL
jgi:hypothetical protein